jgi:hypothetical protein
MDHPLYIAAPRLPSQPKGPAEWGKPMPLLHESIADLQEKPFVAKVLADLHYRRSIFNLKNLELNDALLKTEVELRDYRPELKGDIDILVVPYAAPERSVAIQVKRFKVSRNGVRTGRPNGFGEFKKGVRQANALAKLGYSQVYFWVFVLADTREQNAGRFTYEGLDADLSSKISQAISPQYLDPRVGLMTLEWVQPIDRPPLDLGTYGGHLNRLAVPGAQPTDLTAWLATLR